MVSQPKVYTKPTELGQWLSRHNVATANLTVIRNSGRGYVAGSR